MQAKVYDLEGYFLLEKAKEDLPFYGDRAREIEENASSASDFWILYDRPKFKGNEIFEKLSKELSEIKELKWIKSYIKYKKTPCII